MLIGGILPHAGEVRKSAFEAQRIWISTFHNAAQKDGNVGDIAFCEDRIMLENR